MLALHSPLHCNSCKTIPWDHIPLSSYRQRRDTIFTYPLFIFIKVGQPELEFKASHLPYITVFHGLQDMGSKGTQVTPGDPENSKLFTSDAHLTSGSIWMSFLHPAFLIHSQLISSTIFIFWKTPNHVPFRFPSASISSLSETAKVIHRNLLKINK